MLQFFEVPPGGSVVSPFFVPFFSLFFAFCFCCSGWVAFFSHFSHVFRIFFVFLSHVFRMFFAFVFVICFFCICFACFL